ncbi:hypothetical protein F4692_000952 [Nocardioides cavernae]|uniref:VOC domain-containing protein n=1 Tax=Nocardioides cavernae TaxID=1921566 RepID=A0A7Y9KSI1_9ACTN|nr:VOC family protein [Nocardioides cavernae]NYE35848.1 hypothetical protein [Nocardioides cavernae]
MTGAAPLSLRNLYHTGLVVPALEPAMTELSTVLDVSWTDVEEWDMTVRTPEGARNVRLRFTYSRAPGPHLELLEPVEGTVWEQPSGAAGALATHHVGVWADDFAETSERLVTAGHPRVLTYESRDGRAAGFAYHRLPSGALVELVDASLRPGLERWLAGGPHPHAPS